MKANSSLVCWSGLVYGEWDVLAAMSAEGLCYVRTQNEGLDHLTEWTRRHLPESRLIRDDEALQPFFQQLAEFFDGTLTQFTVPIDLRGTPFQLAVWKELGRIPYGETRSYSDIAHGIGKPSAARAVGAAIAANPVLIAVPCHRVIGRNGALTGYLGGLAMKTMLLKLEKTGTFVEEYQSIL